MVIHALFIVADHVDHIRKVAGIDHIGIGSDFHEKVEALPDDEREVFDLLWYQGITQAEAARVLNVTERTIQRRWQAARLSLYEKLGGELPPTD